MLNNGIKQLFLVPEGELNDYDKVLIRLYRLHRKLWRLGLYRHDISEFGTFLKEVNGKEASDTGKFFAPQMRIELGQRIKELHLEWFAKGILWLMEKEGSCMDGVLHCKSNAFYGKFILLFVRN